MSTRKLAIEEAFRRAMQATQSSRDANYAAIVADVEQEMARRQQAACKCSPGPKCADGSAHCDAPGISAVPVWTGAPPGMLQDDCAGLSKALASKPDARLRAREAALNAARARVAAAGGPILDELLTRFGRGRPPGGWSDSGPVEGAE
jgi:hypothetical protein